MKSVISKKSTVLIVEDESIVAKDLRNMLKDIGYKVLNIADTGSGALKIAKKDKPDIVLMDIVLKGKMDGIGAAKRIKEDLGIPIIFLTGYSDEKTIKRSLLLRPSAYILKPFKPKELEVAIELATSAYHLKLEQGEIAEKLSESAKLLNDVGEIARIGGWEMDLVTGKAKWTKAIYDIVEIGYDEPIPGPNEHIDYYLPKYRPMIRKVMKDLIKHNKPFDIEAEYKTKKGNLGWCRVIGRQKEVVNGKCIKISGTLQDITEKKKINEALKESEAWFKSIFDNSNDSIFVHDPKTGKILDVNETMSVMYGFQRDEALKLNIGSISSGVYPYVQAEAVKRVKKASTGIPQIFEWQCKRKSGDLFWAEVSLKKAVIGDKNVILAIVRDVSKEKEVEKKLRSSEERYRELYSSSQDAIMTLEPPTWRFTSGNPATVKLFGCKNEKEFTGLGPWQLSPKKQPDGSVSGDRAKAMIMKAMKEGFCSFEWVHCTKNGNDFFAEVMLARMIVDDKAFLQATVRDVSRQKKAQLELKEKVDQMAILSKANLRRHKEYMRLKYENAELRKLKKRQNNI